MKITKRTVDNLDYQGPGGKHTLFFWDDELIGFGVKVYPSNAKKFIVRYRVNGRQRFLTLGKFGSMTVYEARNIAKQRIGEVAQGADPQATKQKARQGDTIKALCTSYIERHAKQHKKTWKEDQRRIDRNIIPAWGNLKAKAITRADVASLHTKIGNTAPYEANRTLALLSNLFDFSRKWGITPEGKVNPARDIDKFKEQKRDRYLTHEELPKIIEALDKEPNESARAAIWLFLLTGARKTELLQAQWQDIDWNRNELKLPETKNGKTHYLPLSSPALAILEQLPRTEGNSYILPGKFAGSHLVNISKPWERIKTAAGVEGVRLHDLRRTVGSWLAQAGNSLHLIGKVLNHSNTSTTAIYARFGQDHAREALESHGKQILGAAGIKPSADIIELKKTAR